MDMRMQQLEMRQKMALEALEARHSAQLEQQKLVHDMLIEQHREASRERLAEIAASRPQPQPTGGGVLE
jgi:hypothetical protein